jgi:hypothetical protein
MMTLVTPYSCHDGVIGDRNGIFGDESDLSQKIFSLVVRIGGSQEEHNVVKQQVARYQIHKSRSRVPRKPKTQIPQTNKRGKSLQ